MTRTTHPITAAAARVKAAQVTADKADAAVDRLVGAQVKAHAAHAALELAREALRELITGDTPEQRDDAVADALDEPVA